MTEWTCVNDIPGMSVLLNQEEVTTYDGGYALEECPQILMTGMKFHRSTIQPATNQDLELHTKV
jgi:hypothetical protein